MLSPHTVDSAVAARDRFATGSVETVSGPRIVVMCFDRLDRDLAAAQAAIERGDHFETNAALGHAQDLLGEMAAMLDVDAWEHAPALLSVYDYLLRLLAVANVTKHGGRVAEAQRIVAEIGEAFRAASWQPSSSLGPQIVGDEGEPRRISLQA
jgi:flagellar protein FliS